MDGTPPDNRPLRILSRAAGLGALGYVALFVLIAALRARHPYDLEWMEGGVVDHVARILDGKKLYVEPSLEFTPYIYAPLYFYLGAGASSVMGLGYFPLRLVSILATLGCFLLLFLFARRETGKAFWGLLAAGLFAATYRAGGAWFDMSRADMLYLLLVLGSLYVLRFRPTTAGLIGSGALMALAFLAKQSALVVTAPLVLYALWTYGRRGLWFAGSAIGLVVVSTLVLDAMHDGWFRYYMFTLPASHRWIKPNWLLFWTRDLLAPMAIACAFAVYYLLHRSSRGDGGRERLFWVFAGAGLVGSAWSARLHSGGYDNVLIPAHCAAALLGVLGLHRATESVPPQRRVVLASLLGAFLIQLGALFYDPLEQVPSGDDVRSGDKLIEALRGIEGEVFIPCAGYATSRAGKNVSAHGMAIVDILRGEPKEGKRLERELEDAIRNHRFAAVVVDDNNDGKMGSLKLSDHYRLARTLYESPEAFLPVTGADNRPQFIWVPKR